jgi:hypothetical protein
MAEMENTYLRDYGFKMKSTTDEATFKNYMQGHFPGADKDIDDLWQEAQ